MLIASMRLIISLVVGSIIPSFPLLIVGGRMVGTVLLCEQLSQRSEWSGCGGLHWLHWWCIVDFWGWWYHKCGNLTHILLCWLSHGLSLLRWHRLYVGSCCSELRHHSCVVWSLVLVSNSSSVSWLWCNSRWCQSRLWLLGDRSYDVVRSMGCSLCITV